MTGTQPPILVTGAAGFIGFHVVKRLLDRGDHVIGLDNINDYYDVRLKQARLAQLTPHERFRFVKLDLANRRMRLADTAMAGRSSRSPSRSARSVSTLMPIPKATSKDF